LLSYQPPIIDILQFSQQNPGNFVENTKLSYFPVGVRINLPSMFFIMKFQANNYNTKQPTLWIHVLAAGFENA